MSLFKFRSWFMALVMAEMNVENITMAEMMTTTLKRRSISFLGTTSTKHCHCSNPQKLAPCQIEPYENRSKNGQKVP